MSRCALALLWLAPHVILAGCLSFVEPPATSGCTRSQSELVWLNPVRLMERVKLPRLPYDRALYDPALSQGLAVRGDLQFDLRAPGPHLVEIFLTVDSGDSPSFVLEAGGKTVDSRYPAVFKSAGMRGVCLLGMLSGPFTVRSDSPRYIVSTIRWTPQKQFEDVLAPSWLDRARQLAADPFLDDLRAERRESLEQLFDRLVLSSRPDVHREAVIGQARAAYWLAAEDQGPHDLERAYSLLREAFKLAPEDKIVRELISSSCSDRNVNSGHMPSGGYCVEAVPVAWTVVTTPDPPNAPEWAVMQRRVAARLEAITKWWVERRQQPDGEIGGGWRSDAEILRQWGPQALGFGAPVAATGLRTLADGLWSSDVLVDGYDRDVADVGHSSQATTDTQPLRTALAPEEAGLAARLRQTAGCAKTWIAQQPDGNWRFRGSWFNCREVNPAPEHALDVWLNAQAMGPALWYAYLTRDRGVVELLANWARSWIAAMQSTEHGKPAGIFPPAVRSADGSFLIGSGRWDKPNTEGSRYEWSGRSQEAMTSLLLALHDLTGDARWLEAAGQSFQILTHCQDAPGVCEEIRKQPQAFYEWRRRTSDPRYDTAFHYAADPLPSEAEWTMASLAKQSESVLAHDFDMYTSEVIYTDRVYYPLDPQYRQYLFGGEAPRGDRYPTFAVTWPPAQTEFARAVLAATSTSLQLRLYSFENRPASAQVRVWRLAPGKYGWVSADTIGTELARGETVVSRRAQELSFPLPAAKEIILTIRQLKP